MVPGFGSGQFIERVLGENGVEVAKVFWNMFLVVRRLGILSETFCESLRDCSGCSDMLCLGEKSRSPDAIAFLKRFVRIVRLHIGRAFRVRGTFQVILFFVGVFHKGWEGTHSAGVYTCSVFLFRTPLRLAVGLAANAAARKASGHLDTSGAEVNLQVVLIQPGKAKYHALLAKSSDSEQDAFRVLVVGHDHIDDFMNASSLVRGSIYIVDRDWLGQFVDREFSMGDEVLVDKVSGGASVDHCFCGGLFYGVCRF